MKIYTKKGDKGFTSLFGGKKLSKADRRIEAYGSVDELNAHLGLLMAHLPDGDSKKHLLDIQSTLFTVGAILATDPQKMHLVKPFKTRATTVLETTIDQMETSLEPLKSFILPSGSVAVAQCHVARTVCRRAERRIVRVMEEGADLLEILIFMNRLSDFLFVLARKICVDEGCVENLWLGD